MSIRYVKHVNIDTGNIEFLFIHFDFCDGVEVVAVFFKQRYSMNVKDVIDGLWFKKIKLDDSENEYYLCWDEECGIFILSVLSVTRIAFNYQNIL